MAMLFIMQWDWPRQAETGRAGAAGPGLVTRILDGLARRRRTHRPPGPGANG
jgi:hypothetical protein